jgi:hypothetical protein
MGTLLPYQISKSEYEAFCCLFEGRYTRILTLLYYVAYGEMWVQLVELCCLSEPGYHEYLKALIEKHGTIARLWVGPYLGVFLTEAKYLEVSKLFYISEQSKIDHILYCTTV